MSLGLAIKSMRKSRKLSVEELAERIGRNKATIYRYENESIENIPANTLKLIALALDTTPENLLNWSKEHENKLAASHKFYLQYKTILDKIYRRSIKNPTMMDLVTIASSLSDQTLKEGLHYLHYLSKNERNEKRK